MTARETLTALAKRFESLRLKAYLCPAGVWTIGYGATGPGIGPGVVWTLEEAEARLERDASIHLAAAARLCPGLTEGAWAAVADFSFNLGASRLAASTLRRRILARDWAGAGVELEKWVWGGGRKLPGLVLRRQVEKALLLPASRVP
jgi:lysozyme